MSDRSNVDVDLSSLITDMAGSNRNKEPAHCGEVWRVGLQSVVPSEVIITNNPGFLNVCWLMNLN